MENKQDYYRLLQNVHTNGDWEAWIIYMLRGICEMSEESLSILQSINGLIEETTDLIKQNAPKIYSRELVEIIFKELYTRISNVENALDITRKTASNYLNELVKIGILEVESKGREKIFINKRLLEIVKH